MYARLYQLIAIYRLTDYQDDPDRRPHRDAYRTWCRGLLVFLRMLLFLAFTSERLLTPISSQNIFSTQDHAAAACVPAPVQLIVPEIDLT